MRASWELSPQMRVQLLLNESNYRDGTAHQTRAPNSSVAAEKYSDPPLNVWSHVEPRKSGFMFGNWEMAARSAPQPGLISPFSTPFTLICFTALC